METRVFDTILRRVIALQFGVCGITSVRYMELLFATASAAHLCSFLALVSGVNLAALVRCFQRGVSWLCSAIKLLGVDMFL